jgi:hypothetical protein
MGEAHFSSVFYLRPLLKKNVNIMLCHAGMNFDNQVETINSRSETKPFKVNYLNYHGLSFDKIILSSFEVQRSLPITYYLIWEQEEKFFSSFLKIFQN